MRDDANDPAVPAFGRENQRVTPGKQSLRALHTSHNYIQNLVLHALPLTVQKVQTLGELGGRLCLRRGQKLDHVSGVLHSSCRVQSRSDPKRHLAGGDPAGRIEVGHSQQCREARLQRLLQRAETKPGDDPIFANQGNHVGDSPDGHHFEIGTEQRGGEFLAEKSLGELQSHARA